MIKYKETHPHYIYEKGTTEELEMIDEAIRINILGWTRPTGKDFYITKDGQYIHTIFQPTRRQSDAMYLFTKFDRIELEKDGDRYFACVYTGTTNPECEYGSELIYFVEAESFELAISLAVYESIEYFGQ
jgi:hypothetical protein